MGVSVRSKLHYIISVGVCLLVAYIGKIFTDETLNDWYPTLIKPSLTPPEWIFPVVWPILYIMMGISLGIIWEKRASFLSFFVFGLQLSLNFLWSYLFFTLRSPFLGLVDIIALLLAIIWTISIFRRTSAMAAWLLVPYLLWVGFATYLNASIWIHN